jgi:DNA topoisomerase-1
MQTTDQQIAKRPASSRARSVVMSARFSASASPRDDAKEAGLRHLAAEDLSIRRIRSGAGFSYRSAAGVAVSDAATLKRIRALAIPPAWRDVRISGHHNAHLQAIGYDARGRRQYRHHPRWRAVRDANKFEHLVAFAEALPRLRDRVERDIASPGLGRDRVLATVVRLLETTMIRVGNESYARQNKSHGLASLASRHVAVRGAELMFHFKGKGGKEWRIDVADRRLAKIVGSCRELPGQHLFQYVDEAGERHPIGSADVNAYLKEASGRDISAKDFRTWWGTVYAAVALQAAAEHEETPSKATLKRVIEEVSRQLGNTPAICLKCYVHPDVVGAYHAGALALRPPRTAPRTGLSPEERSVLGFLKRRREPLRDTAGSASWRVQATAAKKPA